MSDDVNFFFSSRRRHTRFSRDWSSDVCSSDLEKKMMKDSITIKTSLVFPPDTNHHGTLFGGKLMGYIDDVASIAAIKFARNPVVTASTDSVDFIKPIRVGDAVTLTAIVTW